MLTVFASALLVTGCESFVVTTSTSATVSRSTRSHNNNNNNNRQQLFATTTTTDKHERTRWYTCCSTKEMVKAVEIFVRETDVVAELGAHLRDVSTAISTNSHSAVMVDVERKFPSGGSKDQRTSAMRRDGDELLLLRENLVFREIPSLADWRKALFFDNNNQIICHYDVLVVDVSAIVGNDLE